MDENFWKYEDSKTFISNFSPSIPPVAELRRFSISSPNIIINHAKIYEHNTTKNFLYIRKSTDEEDRQVLSLEAQLHEAKEFAERESSW